MILPKYLAEIGFKYTTELKDSAISPFRCITDVEFLKRTFRRCKIDNKIVAPLRYEVILDIPLWTRKHDYNDAIVTDNVVTALRELSLWSHNTAIHETVLEDYKSLGDHFQNEYPHIKSPQPIRKDIGKRKRTVRELEFCIPNM
jgi:hypothetical protein